MIKKRKNVLGYYVDIIDFDDAIRFLNERIQNKKGTHVVTINPEIIMAAKNDYELSDIIKKAALVVPDGTGITWALSLQNIQQVRIPGIDLAYSMLECANSLRYRVALIGAKEEIIRHAEHNIRNEFKDICICYSHNGYFGIEKEKEIISNLEENNPNLVLVALGSPKQEFFIQKLKRILPEATFMGIGGSFDVWAGAVERAPEFYRTIGCEWMYRAIKQPQRFKRICKTLPMFAIEAIIESVALKFDKKENKNV